MQSRSSSLQLRLLRDAPPELRVGCEIWSLSKENQVKTSALLQKSTKNIWIVSKKEKRNNSDFVSMFYLFIKLSKQIKPVLLGLY